MLDTIVALATPPLRSALGIVRFSGEDCFTIVSNFFSKDLTKYDKNSIIHGFIKDKDIVVDEVVLLLYKAPSSFTGENSIEIISHGSPLIFNKIISLALSFGARMAERGEYSSRAYLNGKLDLIQAENINDLINAETEESKNISMNALLGKTSKLIFPLKKELGDLLANIEANIDYSEYTDIIDIDLVKITEICKVLIKKIDILIENGEKGKIIKDGINIALVGKPNVGKSSLLNALINEDKAIVTNIKGTTRDVVEGKINLNGIIINLYDTAGIRETNNEIENIGINKSKDVINKADIVIALFDNENFDEEDKEILNLTKNKKRIIVYNKMDKQNYNKKDEAIYISALNKEVSPLTNKIMELLGLTNENFSNPSLANEREIGLLKNAKEELNVALSLSKDNTSIDIVTEHIKRAYLKILSITGEDYDFDMAKEIFSRFCLGK
ncbi:MAG: tRNA uridine-5-carboxymethylaminomethyl(34) synthesis GTPase MnmE [Firmicutes bacterium]|uniref:tRNA modification GTPase MnmE n=1 Tax=Candidatus Onthovivens merdipullorum TaxID=2840889 RepID=A0A9D9DGP9_9BACL|nr:tRNA uridine-5-carboxymethylaminomethyl(34) synthesis GTPase MnmE [Candidatus Onthovivens merdipullorum]